MGWVKRIGVGAGVVAGAAALGSVAYAQYRERGQQPAYTVVLSDEPFELRDYAPMVVAEVTHSGDRRSASGRSFRRLAAYIFAQDRPDGGEKIDMTSPVIQDRVDEDEKIAMTSPVIQDETGEGRWRMRFIMPDKYTLDTLPVPPTDIALVQLQPRRVATVRFSGNGSASDLAAMEAKLIGWIANRGLTPVGDAEYAFYDAPMVPGPMRRNEVLIEIKP